MTTFKPRESIISLFDPLGGPDTPPRNTNSPDSLASDKENDGPGNPPGQLTVFFNRVYKGLPPSVAKLPKGKLIDFGDASFESCEDGDMLDKREEDAIEGVEVGRSPLSRRIPLADIELERIPPPQTPQTIPEHSAERSAEERKALQSMDAILSPFAPLTTAPCISPFADVINSINLSAMTIGEAPQPPSNAGDLDCPNITICPPDAEVEMALSSPRVQTIADLPADNVFLSPSAQTSTPAVASAFNASRRTHTLSHTSPSDPRRASVDLQSSFNLHMQSMDMSFDLLNDKISFLNSSSSSQTLADADMNDDTFDLAKEQLEMEAIAARYMKQPTINIEEDTLDIAKEQQRMEAGLKKYADISEESLTGVLREVPRVKELTPPKPAPSIEHTLESAPATVVRPPVFSLPSAPAAKSSTQAKPVTSTPTTTAPTAPSALRLAKKTWKAQHDRTSSASSSATSASSCATSAPSSVPSSRPTSSASTTSSTGVRRPSLSLARGPVPAPAQAQTKPPVRRLSNAHTTTSSVRPPVRGVQRPPPGTSTMPPPAVPLRPTGTVRASASSTSAVTSKRAAPAPGVERPSAAKVPTSASKTSVPAPTSRLQRPSVTSTPARRESAASSLGRASGAAAAAGVSSARRESAASSLGRASGTAAAAGVKSALPRPATSRLPAPKSGIARRL